MMDDSTLPENEIQGTEPEQDTVVPGATEPEAEPAQPDPDAPGETPELDSKPPTGIDKRISKLVWEREEAKRREVEATRRAAYFEGLAQGKGGEPQGAPEAKDGPPKQEQFETYDEYLRALTRHEIRTGLAQERQKLTRELEAREVTGGFEKRVAEFRETHADFEAVAFADDHQVSETMRDAIHNIPDGAAIAYWLGQNHEESNRIARLSPNHQILELGRISARLAAPPPAPKPQASAAPAPITPVKAGGKAVEGLSDDLPRGEWMRRRQEQVRRRNKR
jgi:hypothetical protein